METPLRMMAVLAHPDDEALGCGGALARYSSQGVETHVVTATRGEAGRHGAGPHPGKDVVGSLREQELRASVRELGVREVHLLGYGDGSLDRVDPLEAQLRIVALLRRVRPQVVLTFGPDGAYGHPDHIAISQMATAAVAAATDGQIRTDPYGPHRVEKLYYLAWGPEAWEIYQKALKTLTSTVDGVVRQAHPWPEWAITTRIDARPWWRQVWRAVQCHETQMTGYGGLSDLSEERQAILWGNQTYYRAMSRVGGGRAVETDLFEGLRAPLRREAKR